MTNIKFKLSFENSPLHLTKIFPPNTTPHFITHFSTILPQNGAFLVMDEVQTGGGATGGMWKHESFHLPQPPDVVTFSKKLASGGVFFSSELIPEHVCIIPLRVFFLFIYFFDEVFHIRRPA